MRQVTGERYVVPLREGGSLPAVVDAREGGAYVVKFRGAGQGPRALVAETIAAVLGRGLGLPIPAPALVTLAPDFGQNEPNPEIQDLLRASAGTNFGLTYLSGALAFDPAADRDIPPELAADIVWFDSYLTNVDRTARNTNILVWDRRIWLIDHGACLYFQYNWPAWRERIQAPFPQVAEHVLLPLAASLEEADARLRPRVTPDLLHEAVESIADAWLDEDAAVPPSERRAVYEAYLQERLLAPRPWVDEMIRAQQAGPTPYTPRVTRRVV